MTQCRPKLRSIVIISTADVWDCPGTKIMVETRR